MKDKFVIAQVSDLHFGDLRFDVKLISNAIKNINKLKPDLLVVAGDLTIEGYETEFLLAKKYLDKIKAKNKVIIAGNHDCRNVGYIFFEKVFGKRYADLEIDMGLPSGKKLSLVAMDSNKPDLNDGEIGRDKYQYITRGFKKENFNIFVLHHHLVSIPGTGRERNIVWDAGDVLESLSEAGANMVLNGHKHVPYIWKVNRMSIVTSGTLSTRRTRGLAKPSFNIIEITDDEVVVSVRDSENNKVLQSRKI